MDLPTLYVLVFLKMDLLKNKTIVRMWKLKEQTVESFDRALFFDQRVVVRVFKNKVRHLRL
jgi:hypothetical protein